MSEFEKIKPGLSELFLRLDAAAPSDPVLKAAAETWAEHRGSALLPGMSLLQDLPGFIRPHAFLARILADGRREWMFTDAGASARVSLGSASGPVKEMAEPALARRLMALFDLVAQKGEPCSGMFELQSEGKQPRLCEVYAAPVAPPREGEAAILAVLNWRTEAMK